MRAHSQRTNLLGAAEAWVFGDRRCLVFNFALGGAYPVKNNGVEEPYPGLPQETVERIQADEPRMLVDWVRVTAR